MRLVQLVLIITLACYSSIAASAGGKLTGTGGVTTTDGASGGGLVPWAVIGSYAEEGEWGGTISLSRAEVDDFQLSTAAALFSWNNRVEVSMAQQSFDLTTIGGELRQNVLGLKLRAFGDIIYGPLPQVAIGFNYKNNTRFGLPQAVGAQRDSDWEAYLALSRVWLAGPFDRTWMVNGVVRATRANQTGLLGFGGDQGDSHELVAEASAAMFLNQRVAIGAEYKQKPDNLGFAREDDWMSLFVAWFPSKTVSLTGAWVDLGDIAGLSDQDGFYLSLQMAF